MSQLKLIKVVTVVGWALAMFIWVATSTSSRTSARNEIKPQVASEAQDAKEGYVGTETCRACHEPQFKAFSLTTHATLESNPEWKGRVVGCEACHGPGAKHVEFMSDDANVTAFRADPAKVDAKIIALKKMSAKAASETCLACHAGKEEHNNFRRGEHWRNDVGCADCHVAHSIESVADKPGSITYPRSQTDLKPGMATITMLRASDPQLCIRCHTEMRAQFNQPFHHKVLEGAMKCSDCHNPHGGFEAKQARLTTGADAACMKCHADKQGPFVFEHAPLKVEGCAACHTPHGSNNPKLLKRAVVRQLCLECHSNIEDIGGAPGTPSFHNQATVRFQNCTTCHARIHGSNNSNVFFR